MPSVSGIDLHIARAMRKGFGVAHRDVLLELGLSSRAIGYRVSAGRLFRVAPNVYALVPPLIRETWWMAAILTCGPGSVLSHESASALYGGDRLVRRRAVPGRGVHVTTRRRNAGASFVVTHRADTLTARDMTTHKGLPVTSIERMIVDLAATRSEHQLADHVHELVFRHDVDLAHVERLALQSRFRSQGSETVLGMLALIESGVRGTRSELEDKFLEILDEAGIPRPLTNFRVRLPEGYFRLDGFWRDAGLVIELDGRRSHSRRRTAKDDQARDEAVAAAGCQMLRIRWIDVTKRREVTVRRIRAELRRAARPRSLGLI